MEVQKKLEQIKLNTNDMRNSNDKLWICFRELLDKKGINSATSILAEYHSEDGSLWEGILITVNKNIFNFEFDFLHDDTTKPRFSSWKKIDKPSDYYMPEYIKHGLDILSDSELKL
ncbi:MAG: hypothetical protein Q7S22_03740 [Candidatus Micrarchaeota archaeon]|nr:hypothetical protein [Candidatus Micrarchaeota archaeon]